MCSHFSVSRGFAVAKVHFDDITLHGDLSVSFELRELSVQHFSSFARVFFCCGDRIISVQLLSGTTQHMKNLLLLLPTKIMAAGGRRGLDVCTRTARCMCFQLKTTFVFTFPFPWNATSLVVRVHRRQIGEGESGTPRKTSLLS